MGFLFSRERRVRDLGLGRVGVVGDPGGAGREAERAERAHGRNRDTQRRRAAAVLVEQLPHEREREMERELERERE